MENLLSHLSLDQNSKDTILEFLLYFSRFEYAMKCCNKFWYSKDGIWSPNWKKLKEQINENSIKEYKWVEIPTLLAESPRKMTEQNKFELESVPRWVIDSIKVVRNNLFHGGKYTGDKLDSNRNMKLIKESLIVLRFIIESNELNFEQSQKLRNSFNTF